VDNITLQTFYGMENEVGLSKMGKTKEITIDLFVRENITDSQGDKFLPEVLESFHNKTVVVFKNFDPGQLLGLGTIFYTKGKGCGAKLTIKKDFNEKGLYPCLGGYTKYRNKGGEIKDCEPTVIGLCSKNLDEGIKPL